MEDEEADALLRYAAEHGRKTYQYKSTWKTAPEETEAIRRRALAPAAECMERAKGADAAELAQIILEYLEMLEVEKDLALEAEMLRDLHMIPEAQFAKQIYEKTVVIIEQAKRFAHGIPAKDLRAMLETGFINTEIAVVPQLREQVTVGDITHSIFPQKKLILVLGANDGVLISKVDGGLFSEREVEELNKDGFFPGYISVQDQRLFLRRAFTSSDKLVISYNTDDGPAAMAIHRLHRLFPALKERNGRTLRTLEGLLPRAAAELRSAADGRKTDRDACMTVAGSERGRGSLEKLVEEALGENRPVKIGEETARQIYERTSNNVSRIETFYACPYQQFLKYGLRPVETREYEEGAPEAGSYVHDLIDTVTKCLAERGFEGLTDEELMQYIEEAAAAVHEEHNRGIFSESLRYAHIEEYLKEEVFHAMAAVRDQLMGTGIVIDGTEREFGRRTALELQTEYGTVNLRGKIDRIDLLEKDGKRMVRVVDYKTGNSSYALPESEIRRGTSLQLITYLIAVLSLYENAVPAGANYMKVRLNHAKSEEERRDTYCLTGIITDEGKKQMNGNGCFKERARTMEQQDLEELMDHVRNLLGGASAKIAKGENALEPVDEKVCEYCDYKGICRFDTGYAGNCYREAQKEE